MKDSLKQHNENMIKERITIRIFKIDDYGDVPIKDIKIDLFHVFILN